MNGKRSVSLLPVFLLSAVIFAATGQAGAESLNKPVIIAPEYVVAGESWSFSVTELLNVSVSSWTGEVTDVQTEETVYAFQSSDEGTFQADPAEGVCVITVPGITGGKPLLTKNHSYRISVNAMDARWNIEHSEKTFLALGSPAGEGPALYVNGQQGTVTVGINGNYTWKAVLPESANNTVYSLRVYDGSTWTYCTSENKTYTMNGTAEQEASGKALFVQYLVTGTNPYATDAAWSAPSNTVIVQAVEYGNVIPGVLTVQNESGTVARGEKLLFSLTGGEHVKDCEVSIYAEDGTAMSRRMTLSGSASSYAYPTEAFAPGEYSINCWFRGEAGYNDLQAKTQVPFTVNAPEEDGMLFSVSRQEGLTGEEIVFSAFHSVASGYRISCQYEGYETAVTKTSAVNGARWGTVTLKAGMKSITAESLDGDSAVLSTKIIPLTVISYGSPKITMDVPEGLTEGEDLLFSVSFPRVEGAAASTWTVNVMNSETQGKLSLETVAEEAENGDTLVSCRVPSAQIPASGVYIYAMYDPAAAGWETGSESRYLYFRIAPPTIILSAEEISLGTSLTVKVNRTAEAAYYGLMLYYVDEEGTAAPLLDQEAYLTGEEEQLEYTFAETFFLSEGNYRIQVRAVPTSPQKQGNNASRMVHVTAAGQEKTIMTVRENAPYYANIGITLDFGVFIEDYNFRVFRETESGYEKYEAFEVEQIVEEEQTALSLIFPEGGKYKVSCAIMLDEVWRSMSDPVTIRVESEDELLPPGIEVQGGALTAGQDVVVTYTLDPRAESAAYSLYWRPAGSYDQFIASGALSVSETELRLDGSMLDAGEYTLIVTAHSDAYKDRDATGFFSLEGEREEGPAILSSEEETYVNREVSFSADLTGATKLRIRYDTETGETDYDYHEEVVSENGSFSWTASCTEVPAGETWYVKAMAFRNGTWTAWGQLTAVRILSRGTLEKPAFESLSSRLAAGDPLKVRVSAVQNAEEYRFRLYRLSSDMETRTLVSESASVSREAVLLTAKETLRLAEGYFELQCSAFAADYVSSGTEKASFMIVDEWETEESILRLPAGVKKIDEESFRGAGAGIVVIQDSCEEICAYAFAEMPNLKRIYVPDSVTRIDSLAFDGCGDFVICTTSAYVISYAEELGLDVVERSLK